MNLFNCKTISINNKNVKEVSIDNQVVWQKSKKRIIDGNAFNILVKDINGSSSTTETEDNTITRIIFDYWNSSYQTLLGNFTTGTDVSYSNDGSIRLFYNSTIVYVLSDYIISTYNANAMFRNFAAIEEINFDNFDTSNNTDFTHFLLQCSSLERQTGMENFDTSNVTTMENMLRHIKLNKIGQDDTCDLNVSGWDTRKVTNMRQMFRNNQATYIDVSNFYTPLCISFYNMFAVCSNLVTLNFENINMSLCSGKDTETPVSNASNMIAECPQLINLVFGKNLGSGYVSSRSGYHSAINLSQSPLLTHDSIMSVFNNVGTIPGGSTTACYIYMGTTNYAKVTTAEISIPTAKNWYVSNNSRA